MSDTVILRTSCRLCGSKRLQPVLTLTPTPLADSYIPRERLSEPQPVYPLELHLCGDCGFTQMLDVVLPQVIYVDYLYETKTSLGLSEHFRSYAADVASRAGIKPGSLAVDIGSNDGTLLEAFKAQGMKVLGIDPAREIARRATARGVETWPELFDAALARRVVAERGRAAVVTVNNLFANVDDLMGMTDGIREILADDGVFVFESFYLADLIKNMVFDFIYHEHISYFSVRPLEKFFRQHGLELIDAQRVPTKGGSLRYTVQRTGGPRRASAALAQLSAEEREQGLDSPGCFRAFAARIDQSKSELTSLLRQLKADGKSIAGYGASATTTTLLYHYGIGGLLDFIVDDNPQRQNLFSPGLHIPIVSSQALLERKTDYVVLIAWRYVDPIIKKLGAYEAAGGHFIVPLPETKVLQPR